MLKIRCTDVRQPGYDYNQLTENQKAKFQTPYIPSEERNYVKCKSVNKIPSDLVSQTKSHTSSVSDSIFSEEREKIAEAIPAPAEDIPALALSPAPAPAPAPTLETVEEQQPYTTGSRKSMRKNFGKPASAYSDFYM